jgi:hypothetical protein
MEASQSVSARFGAAGIEIIIRRIDPATDAVPAETEPARPLQVERHNERPAIPPVLPTDFCGTGFGSVV